MKLFAKAAALLMCFSAATACSGRPAFQPVKPPAERLVCETRGLRPTIPPEYGIDWSLVTTVEQARAEHQRYVASIRTREGVVAGYVLKVEDKLFVCANNAKWLREFFAALPD